MADLTNLAGALRAKAAAIPGKDALRIEGDTLTYGELDERVRRLAAGLAALGVGPGHPVCIFAGTSCDYVASWLALTHLGAVEVPVNTGFRGEALAHALRLTGARVLLLDAEHAPIAAAVLADAPLIREVVLLGDAPAGVRLPGVTVRSVRTLTEKGHSPVSPAPTGPGDTAMLMFTSGSTGPSKACRIPHRYTLRQTEIFREQLGIGADDVLYAPFPLFHVDGAVFTVAAALTAGGTAALAPRFSVSRFWADCRRHGATVFDFMGATLALLHRQPPRPDDADNPVRLAWGVPMPSWAAEFERRFDLELVEIYGLTDAGIVLYNRPGEPGPPGSCGRAVPPFDVRVQDADGFEVPDGEAGELVVRSAEPHTVMSGYHGDPEATADAFRGQWFHSGDLVRRDGRGHFFFLGRLKDVIRRRGENISAFDLEQALLEHPDLVEVAAYGVPSELSEEDVMVTAVAREGAATTAKDIWAWASARLARHMVPRYLRLVGSMPKTQTEKAAKHLLRELGVTPDTADREEATRT
ncbi:AMP-binding protein [Rhizohabitans arisaemae]|uniref:AMP-binding protein n=1 Tax=Rhizohabitans arisaemae TaxID=2720610 RepID=UPI0024B07327|nr:AMP-binding protein [Rhizohabitans arisaemae]